MQMLTVIEERINGKWYFFSQQVIRDAERPLTDEQYLQACIDLNQTTNALRIAKATV